MAYPCDKATYFYDGVGFLAVGQKFYVSSTGGAVMEGYYSGNYNGTYYVFTVDNTGTITAMETISSLGCAGSVPEPSPSPIPMGYSLLLGFRSNKIQSCSVSSEPTQRSEMWSNANESSLQSVATSLNPVDDLTSLNYYMYADVYMLTVKTNGYYSDGTYWYRVTGGLGRITDAGSCPV
jgi:hypothetical protein